MKNNDCLRRKIKGKISDHRDGRILKAITTVLQAGNSGNH